MKIFYCSDTGCWNATPCDLNCPGSEHQEAEITQESVLQLVNAIDMSFSYLEEGDTSLALFRLGEAYWDATGRKVG